MFCKDPDPVIHIQNYLLFSWPILFISMFDPALIEKFEKSTGYGSNYILILLLVKNREIVTIYEFVKKIYLEPELVTWPSPEPDNLTSNTGAK